MSSDEHLGSLAEAVLEAVRENPDVGAKVELSIILFWKIFLGFRFKDSTMKRILTSLYNINIFVY